MFAVELPDESATAALGAALARALGDRAGLVVFLRGPLGAGKTTLARGWLRALGVSGPIRSPTYTLVEPYEFGSRTLLHLDLYRLADPAELEQLGVFDAPPESTAWLIEWPENGSGYLPPAGLDLELRSTAGGRRALVNGEPEALAAVFRAINGSELIHFDAFSQEGP